MNPQSNRNGMSVKKKKVIETLDMDVQEERQKTINWKEQNLPVEEEIDLDSSSGVDQGVKKKDSNTLNQNFDQHFFKD